MSSLCGDPRILGLAGAGALFALGLGGSFHCAGMCGPLSCLATGKESSLAALGSYHLGRLLSYAALGALAFAAGLPLRLSLPQPLAPLLLSLPLLAYAFFPGQAPLSLLLGQQRIALKAARWDPLARSAALGLLTPLLPCGLLYLAVIYAAAAPSLELAVGWMLAFAAGTFPLLVLSQWGWGFAAGARYAVRLRQASAVTAALSLWVFAFSEH